MPSPTETLHGGPDDGREVPQSDLPTVYMAKPGAGVIHFYDRRPDGTLHFSHTARQDPRTRKWVGLQKPPPGEQPVRSK